MSAVPCLLRFAPLYQERVWGGHALADALGRDLPPAAVIGESWEIVDRPEAQSRVAGGSWAGRTLRDLLEHETAVVMGPRWGAPQPFPILVKWLDARERMSLQVHPPSAKAFALGGEPKAENWYIAAAAPHASVIAGLRHGVTRAEFESALRSHQLEPLTHRLPVRRGDSLFIHSGRIHAIDAGSLILEIQENSDTTYRVYDWGRLGLDGRPRALHIAEALECIDFDDFEPASVPAGPAPATLADCAEFRLRRVPLASGATLRFAAQDQARILSVVEGRLATSDPVHPELEHGANVLVPFASVVEFRARVPSMVLVTENFST
jgi:mannose-6-phosphate isomerase